MTEGEEYGILKISRSVGGGVPDAPCAEGAKPSPEGKVDSKRRKAVLKTDEEWRYVLFSIADR